MSPELQAVADNTSLLAVTLQLPCGQFTEVLAEFRARGWSLVLAQADGERDVIAFRRGDRQ